MSARVDGHCACVCDCGAAAPASSLEPPPPQYALLFHLLLSFLLVAYVRWHRIDVLEAPSPAAAPRDQGERLQTTAPAPNDQGEETRPTASDAAAPVQSAAARPTQAPQAPCDEQQPEEEEDGALRRANAKYLAMLKVGMPRPVVEHKMRMEGADASALDLLLPPGPSAAGPSTGAPMAAMASCILRPPPILIPTRAAAGLSYAAFKQMVKVGVPRHVVEHKMAAEGLDPAGLDVDEDASSPRSVSSAASTAPSSPDSSGASFSSSSSSSSNSSAAAAASTTTTRASLAPTGSQQASLARAVIRKMQSGVRKKLHWTTTTRGSRDDGGGTPAQRRDSLWSRVHARAAANRVAISTETIQWMERLFVKAVMAGSKARAQRRRRATPASAPDELSPTALAACEAAMEGDDPDDAAPTSPDARGPDAGADADSVKKDPAAAFLARRLYVTLLDRNKSQNIAIVLARVKRPFPELVRALGALQQDALPASALQTLLDMWPDSSEQAALDAFRGDVSSLATAERFLLEARRLPRVQHKLRCLRFKADFYPRVEELRESMQLVVRGVGQVVASDAFALVLEYVYHLGNLLNFGAGVEYTATVKSVSVSSLAKLSFTKAFDGRVSFLQYLVQSIERDAPHLARFGDEMDLLHQCCRVSVPNLMAELSALQAGVRMLEHEATQPLPPSLAALAADDPERQAFSLSAQTLREDAATLAKEMAALAALRDQLDRQRRRLLDYLEEDATLPLDELLGFIAGFADEYAHERAQLLRRSAAHKTTTSGGGGGGGGSSSRPSLKERIKRHSL